MKPLSIAAMAAALTVGAAVAVPAAQARTFVSFGINTGPGYGYYGPRYRGYYGDYYGPRYRGYYDAPYYSYDGYYRPRYDRPRYRYYDRPCRWRHRW